MRDLADGNDRAMGRTKTRRSTRDVSSADGGCRELK